MSQFPGDMTSRYLSGELQPSGLTREEIMRRAEENTRRRLQGGSMPIRTADFRDGNNNGIDDRDEPAGSESLVCQPPLLTQALM
jgi:hypothetical protein